MKENKKHKRACKKGPPSPCQHIESGGSFCLEQPKTTTAINHLLKKHETTTGPLRTPGGPRKG